MIHTRVRIHQRSAISGKEAETMIGKVIQECLDKSDGTVAKEFAKLQSIRGIKALVWKTDTGALLEKCLTPKKSRYRDTDVQATAVATSIKISAHISAYPSRMPPITGFAR